MSSVNVSIIMACEVSISDPICSFRITSMLINLKYLYLFCFFSAILVLYLTSKLQYDNDTSTVLFHVFTMLVYLCPLVGAIVADSWLGKFKTILNLSIVYAIGGVIVALGAIPLLKLPVQ